MVTGTGTTSQLCGAQKFSIYHLHRNTICTRERGTETSWRADVLND